MYIYVYIIHRYTWIYLQWPRRCYVHLCTVLLKEKHVLKQGISPCLFPGIRKLLFHTPKSRTCAHLKSSRVLCSKVFSLESEGTARFEVFYCHPDGSLQWQWDENNSPKGEMHMLILNMTAKEVNNANSTSSQHTIHQHNTLHAWHHPKSESSRKAKIGQDEANISRTPNRSSCFGLKRSQ